jgi:hypothetical protein
MFLTFFATAVQADDLPIDRVPAFAVPRMPKPPKIDGIMEPSEWQESVAVSGVATQDDNHLFPRPTTFHLAWDADHLYLACRAWVMPGYKPRVNGRAEHAANVGDDGLELHFQPQGKNVASGTTESSYKFGINALGRDGDLCRVAVGQIFRNWMPNFRVAAKLTQPGSAPKGGRWLEIEWAGSTKDFELNGPNRPGDTWRLMLGFNHMPVWVQARVPAQSGYFDPSGYCAATLVENVPCVQSLMEDLPGPCDGVASVRLRAYNPTAQPVQLRAQVHYAALNTKTVDGKPVVETRDLLRQEPVLSVPPGKTAEFKLNEKLSGEIAKGSISHTVTCGNRTLLKYFAYFKTGYPAYWMTHVPSKDPFPFSATCNPVRGRLAISGDCYYLDAPDSAAALCYSVRKQGQDKPVIEGRIDSHRDNVFSQVVKLPPLPEGTFSVEASLLATDGKRIGPMRSSFEKLNEPARFAEWWQKGLGNIERVIPPLVAMTSSGNQVSCWGRSYRINPAGLPAELVSQQGPVLAEPARLVAVTAGREERIGAEGQLRLTEQKPWRVAFEGETAGSALKITSRGWVEQDGLTYVELTYAPKGSEPVLLDGLRIEYPIADEVAECLLCIGPGGNFSTRTTTLLPKEKQGKLWATLDLGRLGSGMTVGSFFPLVWLGSERRGLLWWADSDKGWAPDDGVSAHDVVRQGRSVVLRNHIVGKPLKLEGPRTIAFSYMGSPFRPLVKGWRATIMSYDSTFAGPHKGRQDPKTGKKTDGWNWLCPPSTNPAEWSALWAEHKKAADAKVLATQWHNPIEAHTGDWVHTSLPLVGYGWKTSDEKVVSYFAPEWGDSECYTPANCDYYLYLMDRALREGGLRAIYWDIFFPTPHSAPLNDTGYELPDGRIQPAYCGWNTRRFVMRAYALMHDHGVAPGSQVAHATNAYLLVAMPWIDAVLDGEFHRLTDTSTVDWVDGYPQDRMRALSVPQNWGTTINWMNHIAVTGQRGQRVTRGYRDYLHLYDSWMGYGQYMSGEALMWGINDPAVEYVPFWRNTYTATGDKDVLVSLWRLPGRVLLYVFNYHGKQSKDAAVTVDLAKLGLNGVLGGRDLEVPKEDAATRFDVANGRVVLPALAPHTGRLIGLRSTPPEAIERAKASLKAFSPLPLGEGPGVRAVDVPPALLDHAIIDPKTEFLAPGRVPEVTCPDQGIRVAAWRLPDRLALFVLNDRAQPCNTLLRIDLERLGLVPKLPWQEFVRATAIDAEKPPVLDYHKRTLSIENLPAKGARIVVVRKY